MNFYFVKRSAYGQLASKHKSLFFAKVDAEQDEFIVHQAGVTRLPTFQVYKNGRKVSQLVNPVSAYQLIRFIEKYA